jgi:hypothetical protein
MRHTNAKIAVSPVTGEKDERQRIRVNSTEDAFVILTGLYAIKCMALACEAQFAVSFLVF